MKVAFVYKGRYQVRQALDLEVMSSVLKGAGHGVSLAYEPDVFGVTDNVFRWPWMARKLSNPQKFARRIAASRAEPQVAIFSALPATYGWCRIVAAELKKLIDCRIIFCGLHPTLTPDRVMQDSFVDCVIRGETEPAILPLLTAMAGGDPLDRVPSLLYRKDGQIVRTQQAKPADLDSLPLPDKDLFSPFVTQSYSYVAMVSRGCPFGCTFCEETGLGKAGGKGYFRRRSVESVIRELSWAKAKYGFREVIFKDSYLSGDEAWLEQFTGRFRSEIGVPFKCFCTIKGFTARTADLLKRGGCYCVEFGLQTWNEGLRERVLARVENNIEAHSAFQMCADRGLWYDVDHMFGLPGETEEDHRNGALEYRKLKRLNRIKVHNLVLLPGAEIADHALQAGMVPPDIEEKLAQGIESDFYTAANSADKRVIRCYTKLYNLMAMLPDSVVKWLVQGRRVRILAWMPGVLVALTQGLRAIRSGDLRFGEYVRSYPRKVLRALIRK